MKTPSLFLVWQNQDLAGCCIPLLVFAVCVCGYDCMCGVLCEVDVVLMSEDKVSPVLGYRLVSGLMVMIALGAKERNKE